MSGSSDNIPVRDWTLSNRPVDQDWNTIHTMVEGADPSPLEPTADAYKQANQIFVASQEGLLTRATALSNAWSGESAVLIQKQLAMLHDAAGELASASANFQNALKPIPDVVKVAKATINDTWAANQKTVASWNNTLTASRVKTLQDMNKQAQAQLEKVNTEISNFASLVPPSVHLTLPPTSGFGDIPFGGHSPTNGGTHSATRNASDSRVGGSGNSGHSAAGGSHSGNGQGSGTGGSHGSGAGHGIGTGGGIRNNGSSLQGGGHPQGPGGSSVNHDGRGLGSGPGLGNGQGTSPPSLGPNGPGIGPFGLGPGRGNPGNGPENVPYRGLDDGPGPSEGGKLPGVGEFGPGEAAGLNGRLAAQSGVLGGPGEASAAGLESSAASATATEGGMGMPMMGSGMGGSGSGKDRQTADWLRNENELWGYEGDIAPAVIE
jgi:uncharacterized membrane protein YgcG